MSGPKKKKIPKLPTVSATHSATYKGWDWASMDFDHPSETDAADPEEEFPVTGLTRAGSGLNGTAPASDVWIEGNFRQGQKLLKEILWSGSRYCVVRGPFPHGFYRTLTSTTVDRARERPISSITPRPATTDPKSYALCRLSDITANANQWGEVTP